MVVIASIFSIQPVTHNVREFRLKKPDGYHFVPRQATEISINKEGLVEERRPFTFTCLDEDPYLEFIIKFFTDHPGVTNHLTGIKIESTFRICFGDTICVTFLD